MTGKQAFKQRLNAACAHAGTECDAPALLKRLAAYARDKKIRNPVRSRQTVYTWLAGQGEPKTAHLFFLAAALGVNAEWLGTGEGDMSVNFRLEPQEKDAVLRIYRPLAKSPKALTKWIKDGHELVEISTFASTANPFAKV